MGNILPTNVTKTPGQILAERIDVEIRNAALAQKLAYTNIRKFVYGNNGTATEEQVNQAYVDFQTYTTTGLTADQLGKMARLVKASINTFQAGAIVDNVPEAQISFE